MYWMIKCRSKPATDELRDATIPAHKAHSDKYHDETWFSGAVFTDDGTSVIGSLRFIELPNRAAADTYINADPFSRAGLFEAIDIQRWQPALEHRQLTYERLEETQQFIVQCTDVADSDTLRAPLRLAHRGYLDESGMMIARGPLKSDDGETITGSAILLNAADRASAETLMANDPFSRAGIYDHISIERWLFGHV